MKYCVVIVTYNRIELLKECISCVNAQVLPFSDIVIVNNASTDGTSEYLSSLTYSNVHIINESVNGGGAKGFHDGVEFVHHNITADFVLLIDDDAMLSPFYIKNIDIVASSTPDALAFSGNVVTNGEIDLTHRKRLAPGIKFRLVPVSKVEYNNKTFEYDLCSFCGLIFSMKLIDKVGYPRQDYFIWYDDTEYSLRIRKETRIINVCNANIDHKTKIGGSIKINWRGYYGIRNRGDVIRTYGSPVQYRYHRTRAYIAMMRNLLLSAFSNDSCYRYNYELYRDALNDMKENIFGYNKKYHP